jgi:hypothetical protein
VCDTDEIGTSNRRSILWNWRGEEEGGLIAQLRMPRQRFQFLCFPSVNYWSVGADAKGACAVGCPATARRKEGADLSGEMLSPFSKETGGVDGREQRLPRTAHKQH